MTYWLALESGKMMRRKDREVIDPAAILAIIESADSCRLGLIDDTGPLP